MTASIFTHDLRGILLYPGRGGKLKTSCRVDDHQDLLVQEAATRRRPAEISSATTCVDGFRTTLSDVIVIPADSIPGFS